MLSLHRVVVGSLYKDTGNNKLKEGKIENVKPVVLHPSQEDSYSPSERTLCECSLLNGDVKGRSGLGQFGLCVLGARLTFGSLAVGTDDGTTSTSGGRFTRAVARGNSLTSTSLFGSFLFDFHLGNVESGDIEAC